MTGGGAGGSPFALMARPELVARPEWVTRPGLAACRPPGPSMPALVTAPGLAYLAAMHIPAGSPPSAAARTTAVRRRPRAGARLPATAWLAAAMLAALAGCGDDPAPAPRGASREPATAGRQVEAASPPGAAASRGAAGAGAAGATAGDDPAAAAVSGEGPRVALVIDDLGQRLDGPAAELLALPVPLTMAVLPGLPHSRAISRRASAVAGADTLPPRELFLHLPMQPLDYPATDPGPDALLVGMDPAEALARLDRALASVPGAVGVNNHMGSAATADSLLMSVLMDALASRGLRFLDSLTTPRSLATAAARRAGVPCARNRLFLDVEHLDEAAISARLAELVAVARRTGQAVGIGHPHAATAAVLAREVPRYAEEGVRFVTVSALSAPSALSSPSASSAPSALVAPGEAHGR